MWYITPMYDYVYMLDKSNVATVFPNFDSSAIFSITSYLVARVGFEERLYQVNETAGRVEICVVVYEPDIDCPHTNGIYCVY